MERTYLDCREYPSEMNCTVIAAADIDEEPMEAEIHHAVAVHGENDMR